MTARDSDGLTHIRCAPGYSFCGLTPPVESLSLLHWQIATSDAADIIIAGCQRVPVDRAAAIRDGVQTLPHPVCEVCAQAAREAAR